MPNKAGRSLVPPPGLAPQAHYPCAALPSVPFSCAVWEASKLFKSFQKKRRLCHGDTGGAFGLISYKRLHQAGGAGGTLLPLSNEVADGKASTGFPCILHIQNILAALLNDSLHRQAIEITARFLDDQLLAGIFFFKPHLDYRAIGRVLVTQRHNDALILAQSRNANRDFGAGSNIRIGVSFGTEPFIR